MHIRNIDPRWRRGPCRAHLDAASRERAERARQLAALVDVAPTTVTRIESGAVSPSFDLAQEILTVLGEPIGFTGSADVGAIAAARLALDPNLDLVAPPSVDAWRQRWARIGLVDERGRAIVGKEADVLFRAGRAARLTRRLGAVDFKAGPTAYGQRRRNRSRRTF